VAERIAVISSLSTALSGLVAGSRRLEASASNTANSRSTGAIPGSPASERPGAAQGYQPVQAVQSSVAGGGTAVSLKPITPSYVPEYDPSSSAAGADGMVAAPNVDPVRESVNQTQALGAYRMSLQALKTTDDMLRQAIDLKT
jgi:flagellar basal-body rod protein FlgC